MKSQGILRIGQWFEIRLFLDTASCYENDYKIKALNEHNLSAKEPEEKT